MRFNSQAYDKVFPRQTEIEHVESSVETFKPSETEQEDEQEKVVETSVEKTEPTVLDPLLDDEPSFEQGGDGNGNGNAG